MDAGLKFTDTKRLVTNKSWIACYHQQMDRSNGYEALSEEFLARRGSSRSTGIGVKEVRKWAENTTARQQRH